MGCHGEREKLEDARAEQKWSYIVSTGDAALECLRSDSCVESWRFPIDVLLFHLVLHHSLRLHLHLRRRLRGRPFHRYQFALLQQMVRSSEARNQLQDSPLAIRCLYLAFTCAPGVPLDPRLAGYQERRCRSELPGSPSRPHPKHTAWCQRTRLQKIPCLWCTYRRTQRRRVHRTFHLLFFRR